MLCGIRAVLNQGLFNLYNWGNLILGTLPNAPWTLRFSILVGGSKHFSLSCVSTEDNISNPFGYFFPWPREVSSNIGWSVLCWTLKGHLSQLSFSYFCRAHSSLVFSLRTSVNQGFLDLQLYLLNSRSFLSSGLGPSPCFAAWRIPRQEDVEL